MNVEWENEKMIAWQAGCLPVTRRISTGLTCRDSSNEVEPRPNPTSGMRFQSSTSNSAALPYRYGGKELEAMNGLNQYDSDARRRFASIPVTTTMDPLCEKYYPVSPYAWCNNNPVRFVDPTGMDWVYHIVDGNTEVYYDRDVKSQDDVEKKYGKNSGVTRMGDGSTLTSYDKDGNVTSQYTFTNDAKENKYGTVTDMNGNTMDNSQIIYGSNYTIFGTSDNSVNAETLHKNYFGTSYTGPDNPQTYPDESGKTHDSYQYIPRNRSEYFSMMHDMEYDANGAKGKNDAFFNTSVLGADTRLVAGNIVNMTLPGTSLKDRGRSALTAIGFGLIIDLKLLINLGKNGSRTQR